MSFRAGRPIATVKPWGSMSINNTYIGPQYLEIVPTLGYLEPLGKHLSLAIACLIAGNAGINRSESFPLHGQKKTMKARIS